MMSTVTGGAAEIVYRPVSTAGLSKLADLDRSEIVRTGYKIESGRLVAYSVNWDVPSFRLEGSGDHTLAHQIEFCRDHLNRGARMHGAFAGERLIGIGIMTPEIRPKLAQLAYLHVSRSYRRSGVAARLLLELISWTQSTGAESIYVSATPSESAVGFYLRHGFTPASAPLPELLALEPDDIHMILTL